MSKYSIVHKVNFLTGNGVGVVPNLCLKLCHYVCTKFSFQGLLINCNNLKLYRIQNDILHLKNKIIAYDFNETCELCFLFMQIYNDLKFIK